MWVVGHVHQLCSLTVTTKQHQSPIRTRPTLPGDPVLWYNDSILMISLIQTDSNQEQIIIINLCLCHCLIYSGESHVVDTFLTHKTTINHNRDLSCLDLNLLSSCSGRPKDMEHEGIIMYFKCLSHITICNMNKCKQSLWWCNTSKCDKL